ncbi:MAG: 3'(2'),5'-bisphosphate nucleotidase CysQ [Hyphomicrobiaceae bacterium]|nr:3'(2'),5'-bisphosphate nucleotidase CysQ [Hyphomicrobiaceae bacterium]
MNTELRELALLAIAAGQEILRHAKVGHSVSYKADGSPVTPADRAAEDIIIAGLARTAPGVLVMAEERLSTGEIRPAAAPRFFLVDALDGTREFVNKRKEYTVNIALIEAGVPVVGVVVAPALGEGYAADAGGAFAFDASQFEPAAVRPIHARVPSEGVAAVVSRSHETAESEAYLRRFRIAERLSFGSSLKFCRLAEGKADLYPRLARTMEWDIAAGDAILRRAGGSVRTLDGQPMRYGKIDNPADEPFANPGFVAFGAWPEDRVPRG